MTFFWKLYYLRDFYIAARIRGMKSRVFMIKSY